MKVLPDGTVRIEFEDKDYNLYGYKDITKEMVKNGENKGKVYIDNIPKEYRLYRSRNAYIETADYEISDNMCMIYIHRKEIKNDQELEGIEFQFIKL